MVRDGAFETRRRAAGRLAWLFHIGALTDRQSEALGDALWSRVDERSGLPSETSFLPQAFLSLPEPEPGRAKDAIRRYVLGLDFVRSVQRQVAADGAVRVAISSSPGEEALPDFVIGATVPLPPRSPEDERTFIDWSPDEAVGFLRKIVDLWDEEKQTLAPYLAGGSIDAFNGIGKRIEDRLRLVSMVVLPRMTDADEEDKASAERLVTEIERAGAPVTFALPALLYVNSALRDEVATKIVTEVTSGDQGRVRAAAHSIYLWTEHARRGGIVSAPDYVLNKLINRSLSRKPAALDSVLSSLRNLLRYYPEVFNEQQLDAVGASLENLLEDTQLPGHGVVDGEDQLAAPLSTKWKPHYRWQAAQLAYCLSRAYADRDDAVPLEVLRRWERSCREDPLPEVRAAWQQG
jgi:hypothetical protein